MPTWTLHSWRSGGQTCRCGNRSGQTCTRCWTSPGEGRGSTSNVRHCQGSMCKCECRQRAANDERQSVCTVVRRGGSCDAWQARILPETVPQRVLLSFGRPGRGERTLTGRPSWQPQRFGPSRGLAFALCWTVMDQFSAHAVAAPASAKPPAARDRLAGRLCLVGGAWGVLKRNVS